MSTKKQKNSSIEDLLPLIQNDMASTGKIKLSKPLVQHKRLLNQSVIENPYRSISPPEDTLLSDRRHSYSSQFLPQETQAGNFYSSSVEQLRYSQQANTRSVEQANTRMLR